MYLYNKIDCISLRRTGLRLWASVLCRRGLSSFTIPTNFRSGEIGFYRNWDKFGSYIFYRVHGELFRRRRGKRRVVWFRRIDAHYRQAGAAAAPLPLPPTRSAVPLLQSNSTWRLVIHDPNPTAYDSIMPMFDPYFKNLPTSMLRPCQKCVNLLIVSKSQKYTSYQQHNDLKL